MMYRDKLKKKALSAFGEIGIKMPRDIPELYEFNFHGNKFDIRPFLYLGHRLLDTYPSEMWSISNQMTEVERIKQNIGDYILHTGNMVDTMYQETKSRSSKDILNTIVFDFDTTFTRSISEFDYKGDSDYNLACEIIIFVLASLSVDTDSILGMFNNIYGTEKPLDGLKYKTDLSLGIISWVVVNWAISAILNNGIMRTPYDLTRTIQKSDVFTEDILMRYCKGKKSKFIAYLEGKCTAEELIKSRNTKYKTRLTDFQLDQIITCRKTTGDKINKYLTVITKADLDNIRKRYTNNWTNCLGYIENAYTYSLGNAEYSLASVHDKLKSKETELESTKSELEAAKKEIEQLKTQVEKRKRKLEQLKDEVKHLKDKNSELNKNKRLNESVDKLNKVIADKDDEIKALNSGMNALNLELNSTKRKYSDTKKEARILQAYREYFGELYTDDEDSILLEESKTVAFEDIVETLKDYQFVICSWDFNKRLENDLTKLGLNARIFNSENSPAINSKFDFAIVHATFCSHPMMYSIQSRAKQTNAMILYFSGANIEKMLRAVYNEIQK